MAIKVGDRLPEGKLMESTEFDSGTQCAMPPKEVNVGDAVRGKKIFLPLTASPTFTSLGGIAHCVPESNSVDSMSLPSGRRSPTLMAMAGSPVIVFREGPNDTFSLGV